MLINEKLVQKQKQSIDKKNKFKKPNAGKYLAEAISEKVFMISAWVAVVSLILIIGFVFYKGLTPFIAKGYSLLALLQEQIGIQLLMFFRFYQ